MSAPVPMVCGDEEITVKQSQLDYPESGLSDLSTILSTHYLKSLRMP